MKKNVIIIILLLIMLFSNSSVSAQSTEELEINSIYKNLYSIIYKKIDISNVPNVDPKQIEMALDYIIEIYKKRPDSMEAYFSTFFIQHILKSEIKNKYNQLKDKHLTNLNDPDFETGEKLVFLWLLKSAWVANSMEDAKNNIQLSNDAFINIKENCKNKNYAALAAAALSLDPIKQVEFKKFIINNVPEHKAIPYILGEVAYFEDKPDYVKCIENLQKLNSKFGNVETPNGWKLSLDYYTLIANSYIEMNDLQNAKLYLEMIEKEAPNHWAIKFLKSALQQ